MKPITVVAVVLAMALAFFAGFWIKGQTLPRDFKTAVATTAIKEVTRSVAAPVVNLVECNRRIERRVAAANTHYQAELLAKERANAELHQQFERQAADQRAELQETESTLQRLRGYIGTANSTCKIDRDCLVSRAIGGVHDAIRDSIPATTGEATGPNQPRSAKTMHLHAATP